MMKSVVYVWAYYTLYCVCMITSSTAEEDAVGEQQAEADAIGEQQLKQMQSERSSVWPRETSGRQRHYHARWVRVGGCARLTQLLWLLHREELQVPDCSRRWTKGCRWSGRDRGTSKKRATCRGYHSCCILFCYYFAHYCIKNLLCLDFEYLGGPTFPMGWAYFHERVLETTPTPFFEQPLKFIHERIFERLPYL